MSRTNEYRRLKYVATINDETLPETTAPDYELQYIDIGSVSSAGEIRSIETLAFADAPSRARRNVRHGDVIVSMVRPYLQAIAPIENPPENMVVSTGFAVVRPQPELLAPSFCKYLLREGTFLAEVVRRSVGVSYPAVNASDLGDIFVRVPPLAEQEAAARFLDTEMARLDQLVVARQRQLKLLAAKRRALIAQAVTQGLDARATRRASGVPGLEQVPAHWEVMRMKFLGTISYGLGQPPEYYGSGVPFLRATNITKGEITTEGLVYVSKEVLEDERDYQVKSGDIIVVRSGAYTGDSALITNEWEGAVAGFDMVFRPNERVDPRFVAYSLLMPHVLEAQIDALRMRAAQPHLNAEELSSIVLPIPPRDEQVAICDLLVSATTEMEQLRTLISHSLALLRKKRASLITAAVTGQLILSNSEHVST